LDTKTRESEIQQRQVVRNTGDLLSGTLSPPPNWGRVLHRERDRKGNHEGRRRGGGGQFTEKKSQQKTNELPRKLGEGIKTPFKLRGGGLIRAGKKKPEGGGNWGDCPQDWVRREKIPGSGPRKGGE